MSTEYNVRDEKILGSRKKHCLLDLTKERESFMKSTVPIKILFLTFGLLPPMASIASAIG
jgi:hypothetical protein